MYQISENINLFPFYTTNLYCIIDIFLTLRLFLCMRYSTEIAKARPHSEEWQTDTSVQKQWSMPEFINLLIDTGHLALILEEINGGADQSRNVDPWFEGQHSLI